MTRYLLQDLLDDSASAFPDKEAIRVGDEAITYGQLSERSNQLAHLLVQSGMKPRETAGVLLGKSIEAIVAFFAIMKSGGAYISLDPSYAPAERIRRIIALSQTRFLLTDAANIEKLGGPISAGELNTIRVDGEHHVNRSGPPDSGITDDDLAYILYTSGSTGVPKGVMLTHRNALTFVNWSISHFKPTPDDEFANHAPFQFDLSVFDIYVSIATGARLNIVPASLAANPRALVDWIAERGITYWYSVPSVWIAVINHAKIDPERLSALTNILFAGEVFPPKYLKTLMQTLPKARYFNLYGPTETNVCTYYHVKDIEDVGDRPVPIGRACENTEVIALDEKGEPVDIGQEGELMVRGGTVTKGYYKDPKITKNAFLPSPVPGHNGALLYRTGDIVRRSDAHNYEYIGRSDLMVKCSGYRIELPEVEHALSTHESIEEAAVVSVYHEKSGTANLHAFVTAVEGMEFSVLAVKQYLSRILPRYMIPEVIERRDSIPKNANGKLDRQAVAGWLAS